MADIKFEYNPWDNKTDMLLVRPGNKLGYSAIIASINVGDMPSVRRRQRDTLIRETEDGVIGLIIGGLEWLRQRGLSAAEVENKVRVYKTKNLEQRETAVLKSVQRDIREISNPKDLKLADTVVIG